MPHPVHRILAALAPDEPTDAELLTRFAAHRDAGAFELLVWRHAGLVLRTCRGVLRDHHAAEDAAQAVFLALARQASSAGRNGAVAGWLFRVARRVAARAAREPTVALSTDLDGFPAPTSIGSDPEAERALHEELMRLPERYRAPVLLCFFEGLTHAEAGRRMGVPTGTIAGRMARAKDRLAASLTRRGVSLGALTPVVVATAPSFAAATSRAAVAFVGRNYSSVPPPVLELAKREISVVLIRHALSLGVIAVAVCGSLAFGLRSGAQSPAVPAAQVQDPDDPPAAPPAVVMGKSFTVAGVATEFQRKHLFTHGEDAVVYIDGAALLRNPKALDLEALDFPRLQQGLMIYLPKKERTAAIFRLFWAEPQRVPLDENRQLVRIILQGTSKDLGYTEAVVANMFGFGGFGKYAETFKDGKGAGEAEDSVGDERARAYPVRTPLSRAETQWADGVVVVPGVLDGGKDDWLPPEVDRSVRAAIDGLKLAKHGKLSFSIRTVSDDKQTRDRLRGACTKWVGDAGLVLDRLGVGPTAGPKDRRPPRQ